MRKILKNKLNVNLLSGIFLGILFIVACNSASISSPARAVSALSVYNADDELIGSFLSFFDERTISLRLADGKVLNVVPAEYISTSTAYAIYYTTADCSGTRYLPGYIANVLVPSGVNYYYLDKDTPVSNVAVTHVNSAGVGCNPTFGGEPQVLGEATLYAGIVPNLDPPLDIR
jgi:hypothetical protein